MGLFTASERARALETGEYTQDATPASADTPKAVVAAAAPVAAPAPKAVEVKIEAAPLDRAIGSSSDLLESMGNQIRCTTLYDMWRQDAYVWRLLRLRRLRQYIRLLINCK